ncbi:NifU N-terminal domain-containing protein [Sporolactobacillus kofuensis]|uniref:NifU N-terminal domain-containing protein n=1 Tax=Sporolactobacillus kofuensis TaxID=269672 RepID=A0ABW1WAV5_9BACL|nr:NifU N-terminal domain-containing protein [Sporolactobacillus kofuensis]MCO7174498.1 NifU N-terminal domain-containing protein [Sporolactobacillus kofuensis]
MMRFKASKTPNPNAMKFTADRPLFSGRIEITENSAPDSLLLMNLMAINGIERLFGYNDFLTVSKLPSADWDQLIPQIETVLEKMTDTKNQ